MSDEAILAVTTNLGMQKYIDALRQGTTVQITHIALGDGAVLPTHSRTALAKEKQRFAITDSERIGNNQIRVAGVADGNTNYIVSEIGVILADGTLFAYWSDPVKTFGQKVPGGKFTAALSMVLERMDANNITIQTSGPPLNLFLAGPLAQASAAAITAMHLALQLKLAQEA